MGQQTTKNKHPQTTVQTLRFFAPCVVFTEMHNTCDQIETHIKHLTPLELREVSDRCCAYCTRNSVEPYSSLATTATGNTRRIHYTNATDARHALCVGIQMCTSLSDFVSSLAHNDAIVPAEFYTKKMKYTTLLPALHILCCQRNMMDETLRLVEHYITTILGTAIDTLQPASFHIIICDDRSEREIDTTYDIDAHIYRLWLLRQQQSFAECADVQRLLVERYVTGCVDAVYTVFNLRCSKYTRIHMSPCEIPRHCKYDERCRRQAEKAIHILHTVKLNKRIV